MTDDQTTSDHQESDGVDPIVNETVVHDSIDVSDVLEAVSKERDDF
ncbi:MAG: hypothetical protein JHC86_04295, partial [Ilumatobacteraceae bacterium]|nr:hypothetical protein [Ilumatobacteraceae bacterium]